jgi:hypothetical protein
MLMFNIVGSWIRGLYLMGLGAFWVFLAYYLANYGSFALGLGVVGAVTFVLGLLLVLRGRALMLQRSRSSQGSAGWRDDGERTPSDTGFDPDAAIARYLEHRVEPAAPPLVAPPRPGFGRKQA